MQIELVQIFVEIVKQGGFSRAAQALGMPKSSVSKALTQLEQQTGTKLLVRTTRSQTLTAAGRVFYDTCIGPIRTIEDAQRSLSGVDSLLVGNIKITAPEDLGTELLLPTVAALSIRHPGLRFELLFTSQVVDLVKDGFDLALRVGTLKESQLKVKKIGEIQLIMVASPEYLKKNKKISHPKDLEEQTCLSLGTNSASSLWALKSKNNQYKIQLKSKILSNQMPSLLKATLHHAGVALLPYFLAKPYLEDGSLTHVLPLWRSQGRTVSLLSPLPFSSSAKLRMTADHFATELQKTLLLEK